VEKDGKVAAVAFSPDGRMALSASQDKTLKLWDLEKKKEIRTLKGHEAEVYTAAFAPNGRWALSGSEDKTVKLWDLATGKELCTFAGHDKAVYAVAFSPDGRYALSASGDGSLKLWDVAAVEAYRQAQMPSREEVVGCLFQLNLPAALVSAARMQTAPRATARFEVPSPLRTLVGHQGAVNTVAFAPDGRHALSGGEDGTLKLWEVATGHLVRSWDGGQGKVYSVAFDPDGKRALSCGSEPVLKLWDTTDGRLVRTLLDDGMATPVYGVAIAADGRRALSGGYDSTIRLWDLAGGYQVQTWTVSDPLDSSDEIPVASVAFAPDGKRILSGNYDSTLRLWDLPTQKSFTLEGHGESEFTLSGKEIRLEFKELEEKAYTAEGRKFYNGKVGRIIGQFQPGSNNKTFSLVRFKITCCAGDAVPLNVVIIPQGGVPPDIKPLEWVQVRGRIKFLPKPRRNDEFLPVLLVPSPASEYIRPAESQGYLNQ
jgi:WD40 repeat protein